jgi:hypothetical protein
MLDAKTNCGPDALTRMRSPVWPNRAAKKDLAACHWVSTGHAWRMRTASVGLYMLAFEIFALDLLPHTLLGAGGLEAEVLLGRGRCIELGKSVQRQYVCKHVRVLDCLFPCWYDNLLEPAFHVVVAHPIVAIVVPYPRLGKNTWSSMPSAPLTVPKQ